MTPSARILLMMPVSDTDDPAFWLIEGGRIAQEGRLSDVSLYCDAETLASIPAIVLVPSEFAACYRADGLGVAAPQEVAIARLNAQNRSIGPVHAAASVQQDGRLCIATMDAPLVQSKLRQLHEAGLHVCAMVPVGAVVMPLDDVLLRSDIGGNRTVHGPEFCFPDEAELLSAVFPDGIVHDVDAESLRVALVSIAQHPEPDFLLGLPQHRVRKPLLDERSAKWAKRLSLLAFVLAGLAASIYFAKLKWAIWEQDRAALAAAQSIDPSISDLVQAEAAVKSAIARKGLEQDKPAMLLAILWQSVKASENLAVTELVLGDEGLLKATFAAPEAESINRALRALQRSGYEITATPRKDQSGTILADVTVKAP